jgi:TPR repeat protein
VGHAYALGRGVPQSPLNAIDWYYKAARGFQKLGDRERALLILEDMQAVNAEHPLTRKLSQQLLGAYRK